MRVASTPTSATFHFHMSSRNNLSDIIREAAEEYLDEWESGLTPDEFQKELAKERAALKVPENTE